MRSGKGRLIILQAPTLRNVPSWKLKTRGYAFASRAKLPPQKIRTQNIPCFRIAVHWGVRPDKILTISNNAVELILFVEISGERSMECSLKRFLFQK